MTSDQSNNNRSVVFRPPGSRAYVEADLPMHSLNDDMMDIAFVKAVGCTQYPGGCDGMRKDHRFDDPVPLGENWRHKYLIDIDGMGYSARFFSLLMSESAVLKTTVYREFFSDWIQPWYVSPFSACRPCPMLGADPNPPPLALARRVHFIPISVSYKEIYNVHSYFSGPTHDMSSAVNVTHPAGHYDDHELRKIASEGRKWKMTIGRKVDMEI